MAASGSERVPMSLHILACTAADLDVFSSKVNNFSKNGQSRGLNRPAYRLSRLAIKSFRRSSSH